MILKISQDPEKRAKLTAQMFTVILATLLLMQLTAQMFTVKQFEKATGKIVNVDEELTSHKFRRSKSDNYSLFITLDNKQTYNVELDDSNWGIQDSVRKGGHAVIYSPSVIYNILSLDFIDFGSPVSQFEYNNTILYSFDHHKSGGIPFIIGTLLLLLFFCYYLSPLNRVTDSGE